MTAGLDGWRPLYLGPNLPAEDIAMAVRDCGARLVALSIVYPPDDTRLADELRRLRRLLPVGVPILAGGASASSYAASLSELGILLVDDFAKLRDELRRLRSA